MTRATTKLQVSPVALSCIFHDGTTVVGIPLALGGSGDRVQNKSQSSEKV